VGDDNLKNELQELDSQFNSILQPALILKLPPKALETPNFNGPKGLFGAKILNDMKEELKNNNNNNSFLSGGS